jgi:subtilisin family serine protease
VAEGSVAGGEAKSRWLVAVLDSGGDGSAVDAARFVLDRQEVRTQPVVPDQLGHGTRVSAIITSASKPPALLIGQVLDAAGSSTPAVVAAAILWAIEREAQLVHLSLGLAADRLILRQAIAAAIQAGIVLVAAAPARGQASFPASYPGVLQGTGDARCTADDVSHLAPGRFGGAVRYRTYGGASVGAAHVTRAIVEHCPPASTARMVEARLAEMSRFHGRERRRT